MNLTIEINQLGLVVNILIRVVAAIIFLLFIIPLQIKEAKVKNGLQSLRKELLVSGITIFSINTIGLSIIIFKYLLPDGLTYILTNLITVFNSVGFLLIAIMKYQIYHQQYTPENKKRHELIDEMEKEGST